jgi:hypothetical protein
MTVLTGDYILRNKYYIDIILQEVNDTEKVIASRLE